MINPTSMRDEQLFFVTYHSSSERTPPIFTRHVLLQVTSILKGPQSSRHFASTLVRMMDISFGSIRPLLSCRSRQRKDKEEESGDESPGPSSRASAEKEGGEGGGETEEGEDGEKSGAVQSVLTEQDLIKQSQAKYDSGRYSPVLLQPSELPLGTRSQTAAGHR